MYHFLVTFLFSFIFSFLHYVTFVLQLQLLLLTHHSSVYFLVTLLFSLSSFFSYPIFTTALVFTAIFIFVFVSILLFCSYNKCPIFYHHILLLFTLSFSVIHLYFRFDLYSFFLYTYPCSCFSHY